MATLNDVAKKANVSKMTVSRVINHPEQVTDELKQLVYQAMEELDYQPNIAARALVNNRTQVIKVFIMEEMDTTEPYYMNLLTGIANELDKHAYSLQLVTRRNLQVGRCDGFIVCGMREEDYELIGKLDKPTVLFGENVHGYDYVDSKNQEGIETATEYGISLGYETLLYIGIDVDEPFELSREKGYINQMEAHGKEPMIYRFENHSRYSAKFIKENWGLFRKNTLFICSSDRLAIGIQRGLHEAGASMPDDYGIIGHDGIFLDQIAHPQLTTMKQFVMEMGAECARLVVKKIEKNGAPQGNVRYDTELIERETTRKKPEDSGRLKKHAKKHTRTK